MATKIRGRDVLTQRWYPLKPVSEQIRLITTDARFAVVPAGRRSGKTERLKRRVVRAGLDVRNFRYPDPNYFLGAPTRDQAKRIFWKDLKAMVPKWALAERPSETELTVKLITGASIVVVGMDKPERIEGSPWDGGGLDEYGNMKPQAWGENVRPALSDRNGWCWLTGVPEGRNHYYDLYLDAKGKLNVVGDGPENQWDAFTWHSSEVLNPAEIAAAKAELDDLTFQQEYEASFVNFAGQAYYPFREVDHCARLRHNYNPKGTLVFCFDFNVAPGVAVVCQEMNLPAKTPPDFGIELDGRRLLSTERVDDPTEGTGIIGEVYIPNNSNTPAVCRKLIADWGEHEGRVMVYGDATGGARGTAQTKGSDWDLIKDALYGHFGRDRVYFKVPASNPTERSRVNSVNSRLKTSNGKIRLMVDPQHAPRTVRDFEGVRLLEGGAGEIDKKRDPVLTHLTDAVGYYVVAKFPTRKESFSIRELRI